MGYFIIAVGLVLLWLLIYPLTDLFVRFVDPKVFKGGDPAARKLCLTFDDGPDPRYTPELLQILRKEQVRATFFLVADKAVAAPDLVRQIIASGHEIGFHTFKHRHAYLLFFNGSLKAVGEGRRKLEEVTGRPVFWFRPPWGALNLFQYLTARVLRLRLVLWSANAQDWEIRTGTDGILERLKERVKPGGVIVLHDSGGDLGAPANTLAAVPEVIRWFKGQGYQFVSLDEMATHPLAPVSPKDTPLPASGKEGEQDSK
ncbi:MAG TPA: polysaccharide deacetylase family protein [Bacillota bacterium]